MAAHICKVEGQRAHRLDDPCWPDGWCALCADNDHPRTQHEGYIGGEPYPCECPCAKPQSPKEAER